MDPRNQPGSLGFAWVPIASGAIGGGLVTNGVISDVTRDGTGNYAIEIIDPVDGTRVDWPYGFAIAVISDEALFFSIKWHTGVGSSNAIVQIYDASGVATDPDFDSGNGGFTINILPT